MTVMSLRRNRARRQGVTLAMTGLALVLAGCSATPEWARPTTWYSDAMAGLGGKPVSEENTDPAAAADAPLPEGTAADASAAAEATMPKPVEPEPGFPNLASVPDRPVAPVTSEERADVTEALAADRNNANYTDEQLRGGTEAAAAPPRPTQPVAQPIAAPTVATAAVKPAPVAPAKKPAAAAARPAAMPNSFADLFAASGAKRLPGSAP